MEATIKFLVAVFVTVSFGAKANASEYSAEGTLEGMMMHSPTADKTVYSYDFKVSYRNGHWFIETTKSPKTLALVPGERVSQISFDGSSSYLLQKFPTNSSAKPSHEAWFDESGHVIPSSGYPEIANVPERLVWMSFASADYLKHSVTDGRIPCLWEIRSNENNKAFFDAQYFPNVSELPRQLTLKTDASLDHNSPCNMIYVALEYKVTAETNINRVTLPKEACFQFFDPIGPPENPDIIPGLKWLLKVSSVKEVSNYVDFVPKLSNSVFVIDERYTNSTTGALGLAYPTTNQQWLAASESSKLDDDIINASNFRLKRELPLLPKIITLAIFLTFISALPIWFIISSKHKHNK